VAALPWDTIPTSTFQRFVSPAPLPAVSVLDRNEAERNKADASYQWLVQSIAADDKLRERKSISLNLAKRKVERDTLDAERLKRENTRRTALGKPPFANLDEMEKALAAAAAPAAVIPEAVRDQPATQDGNKVAPAFVAEKMPDVLLNSTAEIMADIVVAVGSAPAGPRPVAQSSGRSTAL
jgi:hypothetical protein